MKKHIEKIRSYHPHVRRNIALVLSLGITALVAVFWINSFTKQVTSNIEARQFSEQTKPFALLAKKIGSLWGDMSASVSGGMKNIKKHEENREVIDVSTQVPGPESFVPEESY